MALALYRKYRPSTFAEVAGQEHVTEPLRTALSAGRINHAYLFSGPRGCGKTSSARILARSLNCAQGPTADPCGECDSCVSLAPEGGGSVDVVELDAASHGGVDDTRELRDRAFFAPAQSRYRIFIIDEAHMVTTQGFNALLKIVEEPPEHLIFVFATTEPDKVLTTIRSRTHHYPFRLMPPGVMRELVERICADEGVKVEPAVFPLVIRAGGGSARDTLSVLDQLLAGAGEEGVTYERAVALLGVTDVALIDDMVDALAAGDAASVYGTVERLVEAGHDPRRFGSDLLDRLRDLVLFSSVPDAGERGLVETTGDELARMQQQSEQLGAATLSRFAEIVHTGLSEMRGATAPRLLLELLCARMLLPAVSDSETALLQRLERVERRMTIAPGEAPAAEPGAAAPVSNDGDKPKRVFQRPHERAAAGTAQEAPAPKPAETPAAQEKPAPAPAPEPAPQRSAAQAETPAAAPQPQRPAEPPRPPEPAPEPAQPAASAPAAPAASQPAASAPNGFDAAAVRRVWTDVLQGVAKRNRPTQALLLNATVQDLNDGVLVLSMPTSGLVKQLAQQRRLDFVRESLREVVGGEWDIQCVEAGAAPPARPAAPKQPPQPPQRPSQQQAAAPPQPPAEQRPPEPKPSQGNGQGPSGAAQQRNAGGARGGSVPRPPEPDDIPPPPEPPDEEPPPDDIPPPPEPQRPAAPPPEDEDPESMLAESSPMEAGARVGRDPDSAAVELFERELGARRIEG
ncbi:DNA polymerase III subunit gamma and tau [Saccharopolyspora terrae]|uniref:DNA polymerase III subunit gamma/tau n=1 Tax=Saccharopolyspora terrae TaxID=2530384 RepID=A0A4R4VYU4_9PSEU|nr:DNA polymerase III subunit gamma and tau [Saccharopolyspora terrae]TDD08114.1 DNA polymerase III subunit gamma and tau [Saccharopolyspora terrae]